jgi:hypothetical protein
MADATIGALRFILGADTAQLEASTAKASAAMRAAARAGEVAGASIVAAFGRLAAVAAGAFAVERIVSFAQQSLHAAAALGRFSDQAGMTAQQFQGLDFALRDALVPTEQLAQGMAIFSRNFSDLQRNTGPFLDFLRRAAPGLVEQFRAARNTHEAFLILTDAVSRLGNEYDRVRILNAAGAEQFARLANSMRQGRAAIEDASRSFEGLTTEQIRAAQEIERQWNDLWRKFTLEAQRAILGVVNAFREAPLAQQVEHAERSVARLRDIISRLTEGSALWRVRVQELAVEQAKLNDLIGQGLALSTRVTPAGPSPDQFRLQQDAIRGAQGALQLYMAQLNQLPSQMDFVSTAFAGAWQRMQAVMAASGATQAEQAAARIGLIQQEAALRQQTLGTAMLASETLARREEELRLRRQQGLITETELQRALNMARAEYNMAQLTELQGLGVTLSFQEQYQLSVERINNALQRGAITAEMAGRAHRAAALTAASSWMGAMGTIAGALAQAFPKQKAFAVAAAIINVAEGITKSLSLPFPLNWAQAAAVAASGLAQINAIKSANPGAGGSVPSVGGGASAGTTSAEAPTAAQAGQSLTINLPRGKYDHEEVMQIIEGINDRVQNGATLISTKVAA